MEHFLHPAAGHARRWLTAMQRAFCAIALLLATSAFYPPTPEVSHNSGLQSINKDASTDLQTALAFESASEFTLQASTKGWNGTLYYSTNLDD